MKNKRFWDVLLKVIVPSRRPPRPWEPRHVWDSDRCFRRRPRVSENNAKSHLSIVERERCDKGVPCHTNNKKKDALLRKPGGHFLWMLLTQLLTNER